MTFCSRKDNQFYIYGFKNPCYERDFFFSLLLFACIRGEDAHVTEVDIFLNGHDPWSNCLFKGFSPILDCY